jgi:probable HAF family extracellular repeat protein
MRPCHLLLLGTVALAPGTALAVPAYTVTDLGTLGGGFSLGFDINARGQVTGLSHISTFDAHAFVWDPATGMRDLGTLGGDQSFGNGINANGQVTGSSRLAGTFDTHAFVWDPATGMRDLNDLVAPGTGWILEGGSGINDAGQIAGSGTIGGERHAFLLTPVTVAEVPEPGTLALMGAGVIGLGLFRRRKGS